MWDCASARLVEEAGFPALATSSAAVANVLGYADGERADVDELLAATARIVRVARVPVSADVEAGFGASPAALIAFLGRVGQTGVAGVNLEDWDAAAGAPYPFDLARDRIAAAAASFGDRLFINARTDLYLHEVGDPAARFDATVERLRAFAAAGAHGVFVPGVTDAPTMARLAQAVDLPLNVLAGPASAPFDDVAAAGVARISTGSWPMRRVYGELRRIAAATHDGHFAWTRDPSVSYDELNALFG